MAEVELKTEPLTWRGRGGVLTEPTLKVCCFLNRVCGPNCQAFDHKDRNCRLVESLRDLSARVQDLNDNLARTGAR